MAKPVAWKGQRDSFQRSLHYLQGRKLGHIKSIKTRWPKLNDAGIEGIEWHTMTVMAGRPGSGKTLIKDVIVRDAFPLNPGEDMRVLEFQLEMRGEVSAIRDYSSVLGKTYKYLCSADGSLTDEDLRKCYEYAKERVKYPIDVVEEPPTVEGFKEIVTEYMEAHSYIDAKGNKIYKKTLITLDHSLLLKRDQKTEKDKTEMLYNLGEAITYLKRKYPIAFLILSQLNRNIDNPERNEDGRYSNYVLESDIFGGDALLQHADMVIGLNRPGKQKIRYYGPDRYIIESEKTLVWHFLKCRNGDVRMSFFKAEFESMNVSEMPTPPMQTKRTS